MTANKITIMNNKIKKICVIDGQNGGIGSTIIRKLKDHFGEDIEIIALGTNAIATSQMLKARANRGASGINAIVHRVRHADYIIGALGIVVPHAMMGEITIEIAEAVALSPAKKILLPLTQENLEIIGTSYTPLPQLIDALIQRYEKDFNNLQQ